MLALPYFIQCITPLHTGGAETDEGTAEQPMMRNPVTGFPLMPGSGVKGALRARARASGWSEARCERIFGGSGPSDAAGTVALLDANLIALPIRSGAGTFAFATAPYLVDLHRRDRRLFGMTPVKCDSGSPSLTEVLVGSPALTVATAGERKQGVLEDIDVTLAQHPTVKTLWDEILGASLAATVLPSYLQARCCVIHDDLMNHFCTLALPRDTRNSLDAKTKTSQALWEVECLPSESLLVGVMLLDAPPVTQRDLREEAGGQTVETWVKEQIAGLLRDPLQLGGGATVGRGYCQVFLGGS